MFDCRKSMKETTGSSNQRMHTTVKRRERRETVSMFRVSLHYDWKHRTRSSHRALLSADSFHRYNSTVVPKHGAVRRIDGSCSLDAGNHHLPGGVVVVLGELVVEGKMACKHRWNAEAARRNEDGVLEVSDDHYSMKWRTLGCWENLTTMTMLENKSWACPEISTYLKRHTWEREKQCRGNLLFQYGRLALDVIR